MAFASLRNQSLPSYHAGAVGVIASPMSQLAVEHPIAVCTCLPGKRDLLARALKSVASGTGVRRSCIHWYEADGFGRTAVPRRQRQHPVAVSERAVVFADGYRTMA